MLNHAPIKERKEMEIYDFYDTDRTGHREYDIAGNEYTLLLKKCYAYCSSFSFAVANPRIAIPATLIPYQLPVTPVVQRQYDRYREHHPPVKVYHFRVSDENFQAVLGITDSIFKWINGWGMENPEDPCFYRSDGSIFFSSIIHEGRCTLTPQKREAVSDILANPLWIPRMS